MLYNFGIVFLYGLKLLRLVFECFALFFALVICLCWPKNFFLTLKRSWKHPRCAQETKQKLQLLWALYLFWFCPFSKAKSSSKSFKVGFLTSAFIRLCLKQVAFDSVSVVFVSTIWIFQPAKQNNLFWLYLRDCSVKYYTFLMSE